MIPDLQSSAAATEFKECLYQNQVTVHCQAHGRCLDCEGCEECKKSGLSASPVDGAQCENGECGVAAEQEQNKAGVIPSGVGLIPPSLSNEHSPVKVSW